MRKAVVAVMRDSDILQVNREDERRVRILSAFVFSSTVDGKYRSMRRPAESAATDRAQFHDQ